MTTDSHFTDPGHHYHHRFLCRCRHRCPRSRWKSGETTMRAYRGRHDG
ncbi:hypothetical protein O1L60_41750 [Streptomyces diastatochromogenes]|nr:hypothetical protein [Streptomyces diastatochromogenes]